MTTRNSDLNSLLKQLDQLGWTYRNVKGGYLVTAPGGGTARIASGKDRNRRATQNITADLNRIGFKEAWDRYEAEQERLRQEALDADRASVPAVPAKPQFRTAAASAPAGDETSMLDALLTQPHVAQALKDNPTLAAQIAAARNMTARVTVVTPETATEWATRPMVARTSDGKELRQRPLDNAWVEELQGRIRRGEWNLSPEGFVFAPDGSMLDGQHRSVAIANAGLPIAAWVIENCPPDVFVLLNSGKKRTAADALYITFESNATNLSGALKLLLCYENARSATEANPFPAWTNWQRQRTSNAQISAALDAHPEMREATRHAHTTSPHCGLVTGALAVFRYLALRAWPEGKETLEEFWAALDTGEMLATGHPAKTLRDWGLAGRGKKLKGVPRRELHLLLLIKCWNAHCLGRPVKAIRFTTSEAIPQPFHPTTTR